MKQSGIRLGGPIFGEIRSIEEAVTKHKRMGFAASFAGFVEDPVMREEYIRAFAEADIVLAGNGTLNYICRKAEECGVESVNSDERDISS